MEKARNPVKRTAVPSEFPGWTVREYANGKWDAAEARGVGLSPGFDSFPEVMDWLRGLSPAPAERHAACGTRIVERDGVLVCPRCMVENPR